MLIKNFLSSRLLIKQFNKNFLKINSYNFSKIIQLKLGDLGEGTKEATIKQWFKKAGDLIEEEEKVVEVYTDKLVAEIPSPGKGKILKLNYQIEENCQVGKALCDILLDETEEEKSQSILHTESKKSTTLKNDNISTSSCPNSTPQKDIFPSEDTSESTDEELLDNKSTPAVRNLIKKLKLNFKLINPTGKNNRILKEDVLLYIQNEKNQISPPTIPTSEKKPISPVSQALEKPNISSNQDKTIKIIGFQKAMTKTMTQASHISSFLFTDEFNVDKLVKIQKDINSTPGNKIKITYTSLFIKAISLSLIEYPILNSLVNPNVGEDGYIYEYILKNDHNISVAIDGPEGLVVPNIKRVQDKSILQIQKELNFLKEKTMSRKLTAEDFKDGTFTISNIGNIGGKVLSPVIMPPQSCIIGISKFFDSLTVIPKTPDALHESQAHFTVEGKDLNVIIHKTVNICISADHRIIDGATVARFSQVMKSYFEYPLKLILSD